MARDTTHLEPPSAATVDAVAVAAGGIAGVAMAAAAGVADADGAGVWWCDTVVLSKKETTPCRVCKQEGVVMLLLST